MSAQRPSILQSLQQTIPNVGFSMTMAATPSMNAMTEEAQQMQLAPKQPTANVVDEGDSFWVPPLVKPPIQTCAAPRCSRMNHQIGGPLLLCGGCFEVKYCSRGCQLADIQQHKAVCK